MKRLAWKRLAWAAGGLLVAAVATVAIGLRLVDTPAVRAEIQGRLAAALGGRIEWQALELGVLPAPHGELRGVRVEIPGELSARAEQVDVYLRLWPLLVGRAEIASVSVSRPEVRIAATGGKRGEAPPDPLAAYRRAVEPVALALRKFAPDTTVRVSAAAAELPGLQLRQANAVARTAHESLELELDAAADRWKRLRASARLAYADLSAAGKVELEGLALGHGLPPAGLRGRLRIDADAAEAELEGELGALVSGAKAKLRLPAGAPLELTAQLARVDLAAALAAARGRLAGMEAIEAAEGRVSTDLALTLGPQWQARVGIAAQGAALKLAALPWKIAPQAAQLQISRNEVRVSGLRGTVGESSVAEAAGRIELGRPVRLAAVSGKATLKLEPWLAWLRPLVPALEEVGALAGEADVTLQRLALAFDRPQAVDFDALVEPRAVSATLKSLPAPLAVAGGSARVVPSEVRLERVALSMLDAQAVVSGTVATRELRLELAAAEGRLGEKAAQWALARAQVPERLQPKTPLRFTASRLAWLPGPVLETEAQVEPDGGPQLGLALAWRPQRLELRRVAIKDKRSDAVVGASVAENAVQASFSGSLHGASLASMLRRAPPGAESGSVRGKVQVTVDRARPQNTAGEGDLKVEALDLSWLAGRRLIVERADLAAEAAGLLVNARIDWEEQKLSLRGEGRRTAAGPVVDARLESPGVDLARLLPPASLPASPPASPGAAEPQASKLWPLPVTGRVEVRAGFVQFPNLKVAPLEGAIALERNRARLEVGKAQLCGLSVPLSGEATPDGLTIAARITMEGEPLEQAARCLTGSSVEITGNARLSADLRSHGRPHELVRNLTGTAQGEVRNGRVKKFALIGNILSVRNIASLHKSQAEGFPYRSLTAKGRFEKGGFLLEEGFFDSDAARLAANGRIDLVGADSELTVLVGLLTTVDRVAGAIPVIGDVFGGSLLALPVAVHGDIRDPRVVPLGPRAVSDRLLGIFERTLKLPGKLVVPPAAKDPP